MNYFCSCSELKRERNDSTRRHCAFWRMWVDRNVTIEWIWIRCEVKFQVAKSDWIINDKWWIWLLSWWNAVKKKFFDWRLGEETKIRWFVINQEEKNTTNICENCELLWWAFQIFFLDFKKLTVLFGLIDDSLKILLVIRTNSQEKVNIKNSKTNNSFVWFFYYSKT